MDHEFGSGRLSPGQVGWDWFSIQLETGRDLMLYLLRRAGGGGEPLSSGTLVEPDGAPRHLPRAAFRVEPRGGWRSPRSGALYPAGWRVRVPSAGMDLELAPAAADQELAALRSAGLSYWEGAVRVTGLDGGRPARGAGYVELTGYAGAPPGL